MKGSGENRKVWALGWRKGNGDVVRVFLSIGCCVLPSLLRTRVFFTETHITGVLSFQPYIPLLHIQMVVFSLPPTKLILLGFTVESLQEKRDLFSKCNLDRSVGGRAGPLSILRHSVCLDFVTCPPHFEHCQS